MLRLLWRLVNGAPLLCRALLSLPGAAATALSAGPGRFGRAMLLIVPVALFAALALPQLRLVMTPSIGAWIIHPAPGPIARGDLVMFTLSHPVAGPKPVSVTKYALCLPGDRLTMVEIRSRLEPQDRTGRYYCNGALLGVSHAHAMNGVPLPHFRWNGVIPPGVLYAGSHHVRGFDSRYFGLVPIRHLTRMERLL